MTIKDIARIAGVSISTVSRVVNNSGPVNEETRSRVLSVINQTNYIPNNSARSLKMAQSNTIGLLVKGISNPFFSKMIRVIEQKLALRGYPLLIHNIDAYQDELDIAIREKQDRNLRGVIIIGGSFAYSEEKFRQLGVPCVLLTISAGEDVSRELYGSVRIDDEKEGAAVTEYLLSLGHRKIGFINHLPNANHIVTPNLLRYRGYVRALEARGIPLDPSLVSTDYSPSSSGLDIGFGMMKQLYARRRDLTAVFAFADIFAIGAAKALFTMGLSVPEDVSVVGFDGIDLTEFYNPGIDTNYQPAHNMALSSIEILLDMLQGAPPKHIVLECQLTKRGSCRNISGG